MIIDRVAVGPFASNCFLFADEESREALLIDPGDEPDTVLDMVRRHDVKVAMILFTHAHLDHTAGAPGVREEIDAPFVVHEDDLELFENVKGQYEKVFSMFGLDMGGLPDTMKADRTVKDGEELSLGRYMIRVIHTPGHTAGSVCFLVTGGGETEQLFSGDTLFAGGIGRTDLWGQGEAVLVNSIRERILPLAPQTEVHPGHGPSTTVEVEGRTNPYVVV